MERSYSARKASPTASMRASHSGALGALGVDAGGVGAQRAGLAQEAREVKRRLGPPEPVEVDKADRALVQQHLRRPEGPVRR